MESLLQRIEQARDMTVTFIGLEDTVKIGGHDFLIHSESDIFHIRTDPSKN